MEQFHTASTVGDRFDDVVVGSSPLMLLQAGFLAKAGRRVCLVDRDLRLGGSWRTATLETGEDVEIACHLIEVFPEVYQLLAEASGVPFERLEAQPIRVHPTGLVVPYFSRILMLASGARLLVGWLKANLDLLLGRAKDRNVVINFSTKLASYVRHQLPAFVQRPIMEGPSTGFVDFMDQLSARIQAEGVKIIQFDVQSMIWEQANKSWQIIDSEGRSMHAEHIHCTTSTNLRAESLGKYKAQPQKFVERLCIVIEVAEEDLQVSHTYVAFWRNPKVARISRIDTAEPRKNTRFLMEFHEVTPRGDDADHYKEARLHMERAGIIASGGRFEIVGQVICPFTANVDQLPVGKIDTNLWGYYSMGNLAAGIAAWRKSDRLPPLSGQLNKKGEACHGTR